MAERKFAKTYATIIPVITITALCLMASVARAQTPAQDAANVAADKQAADDAQHAIEKDTLQLSVDANSGKMAAVQADNAAITADKQALADANNKIKADTQQLTSDDQYFNGTPATPPAPAQQGYAQPGSGGQPQQGGAVPTGVPDIPPAGYGYIPAGTAPAPAP